MLISPFLVLLVYTPVTIETYCREARKYPQNPPKNPELPYLESSLGYPAQRIGVVQFAFYPVPGKDSPRHYSVAHPPKFRKTEDVSFTFGWDYLDKGPVYRRAKKRVIYSVRGNWVALEQVPNSTVL